MVAANDDAAVVVVVVDDDDDFFFLLLIRLNIEVDAIPDWMEKRLLDRDCVWLMSGCNS